MTKVLVLGAGGMLGHKLVQVWQDRYELKATVRSHTSKYAKYNIFPIEDMIGDVDAYRFDTLIHAVALAQPDVIVNCIGIVKQLKSAKNPVVSLKLNALFPHYLAQLAQAVSARLIHISTDCVFNGQKGMYTEDDPSDALDLYGRSKFLGEVTETGCLTVRTSIIGRELTSRRGLVEWFLSNAGGEVRGFTKALYSGFTTLSMADILADIIDNHPDLDGVYQVSSEPISKHNLLLLIRDYFSIPITITAFPDFVLDRSLDSSRFRQETNFTPPTWHQMIEAMASDPTPYDNWKVV